jgi:hypothetical protein
MDVDKILIDCKRRSDSLRNLVHPHELPDDYMFFQDYYGGLTLEDILGAPQLNIHGIGPFAGLYCGDLLEGTEQTIDVNPFFIAVYWFEIEQILDKMAITRNKELSPFDEEYMAPKLGVSLCFYIDVSGIMERNSILMERSDQGISIKVADSFTGWLKLIAEKEGRLETLIDE